jgi:hypothetical protein
MASATKLTNHTTNASLDLAVKVGVGLGALGLGYLAINYLTSARGTPGAKNVVDQVVEQVVHVVHKEAEPTLIDQVIFK